MNILKYWQRELPKVKIMGKTRLAYYEAAGVLQISLLHMENDGTLKIGKTVCLYRDSIIRENLDSLNFLMDVLHLWRKQGRATNPADKHYNTGETIVQPDSESLVGVSGEGLGDLIYAGLATEAASVETSAEIVNTDAEAKSVETSVVDAEHDQKDLKGVSQNENISRG